MKPRTHSAMLMIESAVQMPALTQTVVWSRHDQYSIGIKRCRGGGVEGAIPAMGGKKMARTARKISELHMAPRGVNVHYHLQV